MKFLIVFAAAAIASVSAQCDMTKLLGLAADTNVMTCSTESGLQLSPTSVITPEILQKACKSTACMKLVDTLTEMNVSNCSFGTFSIQANFLGPFEKECKLSTSPTDSKESGSAGSMGGMTTAPPSGSRASEKETTTAPAAGVPAPSKASAASAVTLAAGTAFAAVAASLW